MKSWSFSGVAYGRFGSNTSFGRGTVDSQGFLPIASGSDYLTIDLTANPAQTTNVTTSIGATDVDTLFLYGGSDAGIEILQCTEPQGGAATCAPLAL